MIRSAIHIDTINDTSLSSNIKMFHIFASPKASPVLYKAVVYEPTPIETPLYTQGPIDKKPTVIFNDIFEQISAIRANIDTLIVEVFLNNEECYLFNGDVITPESNSIPYDNIIDIQLDAKWNEIVRASTAKQTCVAIQAVFV